MTDDQLAQQLSEETGIRLRYCRHIVRVAWEEIRAALIRGEKVEIPGIAKLQAIDATTNGLNPWPWCKRDLPKRRHRRVRFRAARSLRLKLASQPAGDDE